MSERKELWLPSESYFEVTVKNGQVHMVEQMTMEKRKVKDAGIGFSPRPDFVTDPTGR